MSKTASVDMDAMLHKSPQLYWKIRARQSSSIRSNGKDKPVKKKSQIPKKSKSAKEHKQQFPKDALLVNFAAKHPNPTEWFITEAGKMVIPSHTENRIRNILNGTDIEYFCEVSFKGLRISQDYMRFDFYIPSKNLIIEYDGKKSHQYDRAKQKDKVKDIFCRKHKIRLVRLNAEHYNDLGVHVHCAIL